MTTSSQLDGTTCATAAGLLAVLLVFAVALPSSVRAEPMISTNNGSMYLVVEGPGMQIILQGETVFNMAGGPLTITQVANKLNTLGDQTVGLWQVTSELQTQMDVAEQRLTSLGPQMVTAEQQLDALVKQNQEFAQQLATLTQQNRELAALTSRLAVPCPGGTFEIVPPTTSTDRECKKYTPTCAGASYEAVAPTATSDRQCADLAGASSCSKGQWMVFPASPVADIRCATWTTCSTAQYQTQAGHLRGAILVALLPSNAAICCCICVPHAVQLPIRLSIFFWNVHRNQPISLLVCAATSTKPNNAMGYYVTTTSDLISRPSRPLTLPPHGL